MMDDRTNEQTDKVIGRSRVDPVDPSHHCPHDFVDEIALLGSLRSCMIFNLRFVDPISGKI